MSLIYNSLKQQKDMRLISAKKPKEIGLISVQKINFFSKTELIFVVVGFLVVVVVAVQIGGWFSREDGKEVGVVSSHLLELSGSESLEVVTTEKASKPSSVYANSKPEIMEIVSNEFPVSASKNLVPLYSVIEAVPRQEDVSSREEAMQSVKNISGNNISESKIINKLIVANETEPPPLKSFTEKPKQPISVSVVERKEVVSEEFLVEQRQDKSPAVNLFAIKIKVTEINQAIKRQDQFLVEKKLEQLGEIAGTNSIIFQRLQAYSLLMNREFQEAAIIYQNLILQNPNDLEVNMNLIIAFSELGNQAEAKRLLGRLSYLFPESRRVKKYTKMIKLKYGY